jgi:hypothetical protein
MTTWFATPAAVAARAGAPVLEAVGVVKGYRGGDGGHIRVLDGVDLTVRRARWWR